MSKRIPRRRKPECDFLEQRSLLSTGAGAMATASDSTSGQATVGTVTGGGLLNVGPAPSANDVFNFQQVAADNNAVMFLAEMESLEGTDANLKQEALSVLNDARNVELLAWSTAQNLGVTLPYGVQGTIAGTVQAVASAGANGVDQNVRTAMNQALTALYGQISLVGGGTNSALQSFSKAAMPVVQNDLAMLSGSTTTTGTTTTGTTTSTLPASPNVPSSTTIGAGNLSMFATAYSMNVAERFLAQYTLLVSPNRRVDLYARKLLNDHATNMIKMGMYASATGTYLPPAIEGADIGSAMGVLEAGNRGTGGRSQIRVQRVYLRTMVQTHTMSLQSNEATLASTSDPVLREFAMAALGTDFMHRQAAKDILRNS